MRGNSCGTPSPCRSPLRSTRTATRITIFLEEPPGVKFSPSYRKGDQFKPEFLAIAPNNRIPAMVDHAPKGGGKPISIFDPARCCSIWRRRPESSCPPTSTAVTTRSSGRSGRWAGSTDGRARTTFRNYAVEKLPYAIDRYVNETNRLYGVLNKRLGDREFIAGDYSIADMAAYPGSWPYKNQGQTSMTFRISSAGWKPSAPACDDARLCQGERGQPEFRPARDPHRGGAQAVVRPDAGV